MRKMKGRVLKETEIIEDLQACILKFFHFQEFQNP